MDYKAHGPLVKASARALPAARRRVLALLASARRGIVQLMIAPGATVSLHAHAPA